VVVRGGCCAVESEERRGAKISDHVVRVPCGFGVRLGLVGGSAERGVGHVEHRMKAEWYSYWSSETNGRVC
jgi:hypothetical protein